MALDTGVAGPVTRPSSWWRPPGSSGWTRTLRLIGVVSCVVSLIGGALVVIWGARGGIDIFGWWLIQGFTKFIVAAGGILGGLGLGLSSLVISFVVADTADKVAVLSESKLLENDPAAAES
ncbi:MAG: hypothetical protein LBK42_13670 [Propionibacteriaceae bacterium]|jgi:hypothetical protein|nr:hypothetical protein [Propionibacteriaceae bacterium]